MNSRKMFYTPEKHICVGEILREDGTVFIRIKKPDRNIYETISLEEFIEILTRIQAS